MWSCGTTGLGVTTGPIRHAGAGGGDTGIEVEDTKAQSHFYPLPLPLTPPPKGRNGIGPRERTVLALAE